MERQYKMKVVILARWNEVDDIFGSTAVFDTLRVGFPNADVEIYHSGNIRIINEASLVKGAVLTYINNNFRHDEWIQWVVNEEQGEIVFVDTDMIFYTEVERMIAQYPAAISGRLVPAYYNEVVRADEVERFHTSLLHIKSCADLKLYIKQAAENRHNYPFNPFAPFQFKIAEKPFFFDTCANLYHTLPYHLKHAFTNELLNCYTHLVSGTMLKHVSSRMKDGERFKKLHLIAKEDKDSVKYLWREQSLYYKEHPLRNGL